MDNPIEKRGPGRPPLQRPAAQRSEDPRRDAASRAKEILEHIGTLGENSDEFYIDPACVPEGWSYEWKAYSILGQVDASRQIELARKGWEPVPTSRHPEMMPADTSEKIVMRKGNMLMERPKEITEMVRANDLRMARDQVQSKKEQLSAAPPGTFERTNKDSPMAKVKTSFTPMPVAD